MRLYCPDCGSAIPADDMNLDTALAKCRGCDSVFSFKEAVESERPRLRQAEQPKSSRADTPRPDRLMIEERMGTWTAQWRWFTWHYIPLLFFCIAWDAFLIFWYSMAFGSDDTPWLMIVFPIGHVAVGVGLTYTLLTGFLNRTRVELARSALTVRHGPLPWYRNRTVPTGQIKQLYCEQSSWQTNGQHSFKLCALLKDGRKIVLVGGCPDTEIPRFLEAELERRLRIPDEPVAGEV